jgi:hypothetical protein
MIRVVSAYVPIEGHPRSEAEYDKLGEPLLNLKHKVFFAKGDLERCWLHKYLADKKRVTWSTADNPMKNTLAYHIVQAQKTTWLEIGSICDPQADVFVWIDYGIFHIPGVTQEIVEAFLDRAENERAIAIPGCWNKNQFEYRDDQPCWRFCGGVMVVPREYVQPFNLFMQDEYVRWFKQTGNISWDVNTLARLEARDDMAPLWWYKANHDHTLFTNYRATVS